MASTQEKQWGTTPPISTALPTQAELDTNDALMIELRAQNNFEQAEDTEKRKTTLQLIQKATVEFVKHVSKLKNLPKSTVENSGGKIFTFGSYRLGVYGPGSDIDTLVVVPKHVTREDFFAHFPTILQSMAPPKAVEEMTSVPDAYVPIIKLELSGISIDLIFARLALATVDSNLVLKDNNILRGLEERDLRSLNGTRVTDEILDLVPQAKTFRTALRGVKLWAQRRAIYANVIGFPGGVAWAMMVARTCQLYPRATGSMIISKFFRIMGRWNWPQPILLKSIEEGPLQVRVWNPRVYHGDKYHLLPVITPAYPSMCATHNVTLSTKAILEKEWDRAGGIADRIMVGQAQWKDLFAKHTFFTQDYKYYLSINAASKTQDAQHIWGGLVESKVRLLVQNIENDSSVALARPFNKGFSRVHRCQTDEDREAVIRGELKFQAKDTATETTDNVKDPRHDAIAEGGTDLIEAPSSDDVNKTAADQPNVFTTTYYIGLELANDGAKRLDISFQTNQFCDTCKAWPQFNPELNSLHISYVRNYDLPLDVFGPGESRPERPKKKSSTKKRDLAASGLEFKLL